MVYGVQHQDSIFPNLLALHAFNTASFYLQLNEDDRALSLLNLATFFLDAAIDQGQPEHNMLKNKAYVASRKVECLLRLNRPNDALATSDTAIQIALHKIKHNNQLISFLLADRIPLLNKLNRQNESQRTFEMLKTAGIANLKESPQSNPYLWHKNYGILSFDYGSKQEAIWAFNQALKLNDTHATLLPRIMLSRAYLYNNNLTKATNLINEKNDHIAEINGNLHEIHLIKHFLKYYSELYELSPKAEYIKLIKFYVNHFYTNTLQNFLNQTLTKVNEEHFNLVYDICEEALAAHEKWNIFPKEQLIKLHDNIRGIDLWSERINNQAWTLNHQHIDILEYRSSLIRELNKIRSQNSQHVSYNQVSSDSTQLRLFTITDSLKILDKKYGKRKFSFESIVASDLDLQSLQRHLSHDECIFSFMFDFEAVYLLAITNNDFFQHSIPLNELSTCLSAYINNIVKGTNKKAHCNIYQLLFAPFLDAQSRRINRLFIIQDQELNYLPVESLELPNGAQMVDSFSISYHLSTRLLLAQLKSRHQPSSRHSLISFAPSYESEIDDSMTYSTPVAVLIREGEYKLPGAKLEAKIITDSWPGALFKGEDANASSFKRVSGGDNILHLAMHAIIDEHVVGSSYLHFSSPETPNLSVDELGLLDIKSPLVVLSACNTGVGKIGRGSSTKSLARGFLSAGVPSVLMSLWRVPNESTSEIMISFYKHLATGVTKDVALQRAKLDYLNNVEDPSLAHPYYWAGFVVFGDTRPLLPPKSKLPRWILGGLALVGIGYLVYKSIQKHAA